MQNVSVLYKVLVLYFILNVNIIKSFVLPNIHISLQSGYHLTNGSSRNDTTNSKNSSNILCPAGVNDVLYAYPFSKFGYILCWDHRTIVEFCPYGTVYNFYAGKCLPVVRPQLQPEENFYLHNCPYNDRQKHFYPYDARKYIQCSRGVLTVLICRSGKMFSIQQRRCLPEMQIFQNDHVPGPAAPNDDRKHSSVPVAVYKDKIICPLNLFGVFPHPFSNQKYLKCVEGRLYAKSCGRGLVYNFISKFCVKNFNNLFRILPPFPNHYVDESVIETQISDHLTFLKCPKNLSGTFVHPFSCLNYVDCSPAGTHIKTCDSGKIYSFRIKQCVTPIGLDEYDHVPCLEGNVEEEEVEEELRSLGVFCSRTGSMNYPHPQSQYKYVNCNNGVRQVKRCPRNEIFSLDDLKCVAESMEVDEQNDDE